MASSSILVFVMDWLKIKIPNIHPLRLLNFVNLLLACVVGLLLSMATVAYLSIPSELLLPKKESSKIPLLKGAFTWDQTAYDAIGAPAFELRGEPPRLQLPDLRQLLVYYGVNSRPDVKDEQKNLHLALRGTGPDPTLFSLSPGEKRYLESDTVEGRGKYALSRENAETPLWIKVDLVEGGLAEISVGLRSPQGEEISTPEELRIFRLEERKMPRVRTGTWKIGEDRVDGSLLARQKARWFGQDRFLEEHGGEAYSYAEGKERIEFGTETERYAVFVGLEETLVWDEGRWKETSRGTESKGKPLMQVKRIEERVMGLEIWDVDGQNHLPLNLIRSRELWRPEIVQNDFRFVGSRTRTQSIVEIRGERTILSPQDWLLRTQDGWIKVDTEEAIDNYVERKLEGELFVFDGIVRKEGQQIFQGHIFSVSRHDIQFIELSTQKREATIYSKPQDEEEEEGEEGDEAEEISRILSEQRRRMLMEEEEASPSLQKVLERQGDK